MTRRTRRALAVVGATAALGIGLPLWAPAVLRTVPAFHVSAALSTHSSVRPEAVSCTPQARSAPSASLTAIPRSPVRSVPISTQVPLDRFSPARNRS